MNPADIWTTLRLPTRVNANKPAFSLEYNEEQKKKSQPSIAKSEYSYICGTFEQESYTETDDPFPVPNIPDNRMPTP